MRAQLAATDGAPHIRDAVDKDLEEDKEKNETGKVR